MTPEAFFGGSWRGDGQVRGPFGRLLRSFQVEFAGLWSEEHRAFHLDETVRYADGQLMERRWAIHTDGEGALVGVDAMQASQMRVRPTAGGFRIWFDRPGAVVKSPAVRAAVLDFSWLEDGALRGEGRTRWLGFPLVRTDLVLRQQPGADPGSPTPP